MVVLTLCICALSRPAMVVTTDLNLPVAHTQGAKTHRAETHTQRERERARTVEIQQAYGSVLVSSALDSAESLLRSKSSGGS